MRSRIGSGCRSLGFLAGLGMLSGCAGGLPLGPDVAVSGQNFPAAQGEADVIIRTHVVNAAGDELEVGGATCVVNTVLYGAKLTTPARLRLPNFGPQSPDLMIDCAAGGQKGRFTQPIVVNWRTAPGYYAPGPWGGYGPGWGPGWGPWGYPEPAYPVWRYPDVSVRLN